MRAAIYARFSTEKQSEASIEDQFRVCERSRSARGSPLSRVFPHSIWLEENGDQFYAVFEDGLGVRCSASWRDQRNFR
jgi:hypothetical protein